MNLLRPLICILLLPALLLAESVELAGVKFPIQEFTKIDSSTVKISVLGKPKIVRKENAEDEIVRQFFSSWDKTNNLGLEKASDFCIQALAEGKQSWALTAFDALALTFADKQDETISTLEKAVAQAEIRREFLIDLLELPSSSQYRARLLGAILFLAAVEDLDWVKLKRTLDLKKYSKQLKDYAAAVILKNVKSGRGDLGDRQVRVLEALYTVRDPVVAKVKADVAVLLGPAHGLRESPKAARTAFEAFRREPSATSESERVFLPLIHAQAEKVLVENQPVNALEYLSLVDINNRTPETHDLAVEALSELQAESLMSLSKEVTAFIGQLSKHDERIAKAYLGHFETKFFKLLNENEPQQAETQLRFLVGARQDPNADNDRLRIALALTFLDQGLKSAAKEQINKIQTGIGFYIRLKLIFSGLYIPVPVLLFLLFVPMLGTLSYLIKARNKLKKAEKIRAQRAYARMREEEELVKFRGFKRQGGPGGIGDPLMAEYQQLLQEFGLSGKVSARQIKSAYRKKAKSAHPDMNQGEESEDFLTLKKDYEKLLDLRQKLAID